MQNVEIVLHMTAPAAGLTACEAVHGSAPGAYARGRSGKDFFELTPQDGALSAWGVTPLYPPTDIHPHSLQNTALAEFMLRQYRTLAEAVQQQCKRANKLKAA